MSFFCEMCGVIKWSSPARADLLRIGMLNSSFIWRISRTTYSVKSITVSKACGAGYEFYFIWSPLSWAPAIKETPQVQSILILPLQSNSSSFFLLFCLFVGCLACCYFLCFSFFCLVVFVLLLLCEVGFFLLSKHCINNYVHSDKPTSGEAERR